LKGTVVIDDTPGQRAAEGSVAPALPPAAEAPSIVELAAALLSKKEVETKAPPPASTARPSTAKAAATPKPTRGTASKSATQPATAKAARASKPTTTAKPAAKSVSAATAKSSAASAPRSRAPRKIEQATAPRKPASKPFATTAPTEKAPAEGTPDTSMRLVPETTAKPKKAKLVRDSFTMPDAEYALIAAVKRRCIAQGVAAKKSEVLRAAVIGFAALADSAIVAAVQSLDSIKTGRPPKKTK
jgi:hypothetical protein